MKDKVIEYIEQAKEVIIEIDSPDSRPQPFETRTLLIALLLCLTDKK